MKLPSMIVVFATWDFRGHGGRICHAARSIMNDASYGGFQFAAFCGASEHSDEIEYDVIGAVGCSACQEALGRRDEEVEAAAAGVVP